MALINNKTVELISPAGEIEPCEIEYQFDPIDSSTTLTTRSQHFGELTFTDWNLFSALVQFRLRLEQEGYNLLCNAARRDGYPSRMALDMGRGQSLYLLKPGIPATSDDFVPVLDPATADQVCSVAAQREWYEQWRKSIGTA